jgi:hypothetical protein
MKNKMLYYKNALKDVEENLNYLLCKNTSKFVKKYFKERENNLKFKLLMIRPKNCIKKMDQDNKFHRNRKMIKFPNGKSKVNC